jgi:hypothetical protein
LEEGQGSWEGPLHLHLTKKAVLPGQYGSTAFLFSATQPFWGWACAGPVKYGNYGNHFTGMNWTARPEMYLTVRCS